MEPMNQYASKASLFGLYENMLQCFDPKIKMN